MNTEDLIQRYLDNSITDEELRQLGELIKDDPDFAREFVFATKVESLSFHLIRSRPVEAPVPSSRTPKIRKITLHRIRAERSNAALVACAVAAGVVVIFGAIALFHGRPPARTPAPDPREVIRENFRPASVPVKQGPTAPNEVSTPVPERELHVAPSRGTPQIPKPPEPVPRATPARPSVASSTQLSVPEPVARFRAIQGEVTLLAGLEKKSAKADMRIAYGEGIRTVGQDSFAVVEYPDGTELKIRGDTLVVRLAEQHPAGKNVFVEQGIVWADVAPQPQAQPMMFITPHADARVVGTQLVVTVDQESTRVHVREGKVQVSRKSGGSGLTVAPGQYIVAKPGVEFAPKPVRPALGLRALYLFDESGGSITHDVSGSGAPLDLNIQDPQAVKWLPRGLLISSPTILSTDDGAAKIFEACKRSNEISIEAWLRPANIPQYGGSRFITLSNETGACSFTLGQEHLVAATGQGQILATSDLWTVRLRTSRTGSFGEPPMTSPQSNFQGRLTHVVYTRGADGTARIFVDGDEVAAGSVPGAFNNWEAQFRLAVANEHSNHRPWLGEIHLLAIYSRALNAREVGQFYKAGVP